MVWLKRASHNQPQRSVGLSRRAISLGRATTFFDVSDRTAWRRTLLTQVLRHRNAVRFGPSKLAEWSQSWEARCLGVDRSIAHMWRIHPDRKPIFDNPRRI